MKDFDLKKETIAELDHLIRYHEEEYTNSKERGTCLNEQTEE